VKNIENWSAFGEIMTHIVDEFDNFVYRNGTAELVAIDSDTFFQTFSCT